MDFGFMGLSKPYETLWHDGRKVLIYPNGKIVDVETGLLIRKGDEANVYEDKENISLRSTPIPRGDNDYIFLAFFAFLLAIIVIVALSKDGRK